MVGLWRGKLLQGERLGEAVKRSGVALGTFSQTIFLTVSVNGCHLNLLQV